MSVDAETIKIVGALHQQVLELRTALEDALDAIDFARTEGFEWPTDPYTRAILKVCPPIRLTAKEPTENTPGTGGEHDVA